jgi:hypothetical protein
MGKALQVLKAYSVAEIRSTPHGAARDVEYILWPSRDRYLWNPSSSVEDDGHDFLALADAGGCTCCGGRGRFERWKIAADSGEGGGGVTDHGALTGLADDDHPQYTDDAEAAVIADGIVDSRLSDADPLPLAAVADPGVSQDAARADHVHPTPEPADPIDVVVDAQLVKEEVVKDDSDFTTSSTSGDDITGTQIDIDLPEGQEVLIFVSGSLKHDFGDEANAQLGISVDGTYYFGGHFNTNHLGYAIDAPGSLSKAVQLASGEHTIHAALRRIGAVDDAVLWCDADHPLTLTVVYLEKDTVTVVPSLLSTTESHASSHENGGLDEIDVTGLSGELADPQPPKAHATSHQAGGSDAIKLDDLAEPDDNADLNASTAKHGLMPKGENSPNKAYFSDMVQRDLTTTKGDLLAHDGTEPKRLPVGPDGSVPVGDATASVGVAWKWFAGAIGAAISGSGRDGAVSCGSGTVTVSAGGVLNYTTLDVGTGTWSHEASTSLIVVYATLITGSGGILQGVTGTAFTNVGGTGGTGASGGGSGGAGGRGCGAMFLYALTFTGSGTARITSVGINGSNGANATAAAAIGNGAAGGNYNLALRLFGLTDTAWHGGAIGTGQGGLSAGGGGTGAGTGSLANDADLADVLYDWIAYLTPRPSRSTVATDINGQARFFTSRSGNGGGAGGRNNGGAQGAGGGGSGVSTLPTSSDTLVAGATGNAGTAGASGAGGGAGGNGGAGGFLCTWSNSIPATWTFTAPGGNGGNGGNGSGNGGGGAEGLGGPGGMVIVFTPTPTSATLSAPPGSNGSKGTGGTPAASAGSAPAGFTKNMLTTVAA